jgi:hypothetical protein
MPYALLMPVSGTSLPHSGHINSACSGTAQAYIAMGPNKYSVVKPTP